MARVEAASLYIPFRSGVDIFIAVAAYDDSQFLPIPIETELTHKPKNAYA